MKGCLLAALLVLPWTMARGADGADTNFQSVVVRQGDTLWGIAKTYLKDPSKWDQILRYNRLPSSDPTVALPGMTLRVPVSLIKESMRAAKLIYMINRVLFRRRETADWKGTTENMELYRGDTVKTMDASKAKVRFLNADLLSLDPNSQATIKPLHEDYDVFLKNGGLFVGHSRVVTESARITPKTSDTQYSARVKNDLSTVVEVYTGVAAVEGQGKVVDVKAGMASEVKLGLAPSVPTKIADLPDFEARAAEFNGQGTTGLSRVKLAAGAQLPTGAGADDINSAGDAGGLRADVNTLSVGVPISGYRVQSSRTRNFEKLVFDKVFDPDSKIDLTNENVQPGVYWFRIALIDLLGVEQAPSSPRLYSVGLANQVKTVGVDLKASIVVSKPLADEDVANDVYTVMGRVSADNLTVKVNGKPARQDEEGNFSLEIKLSDGPNVVDVTVSDADGNVETVSRRVTLHGRF